MVIPGVRRVCLDCGIPNLNGSYCAPCEAERERVRSRRRGSRHYTAEYRKAAAKVRATATACWICGEGSRENDPWTADHLRPGDPESPLAPAHRSCNSRRGNKRIDEM